MTSTTSSVASTTSATFPLPEANPGWRQLPTAPLEGRIWHSTTWTGEELIIWGGLFPATGAVHDNGAVFDISAGQWRALPGSPLEGRVGHTAVWSGDEVIVWGGHKGGVGGKPTGRLSDGAAYNPGSDTWRPISTPDLTGGPGYASVWTGSEMIVIGGNDGHLSFAENGLYEAGAYDPGTDTWRILDMPINLAVVDALWTGEEVVVYGVVGYLGPLQGMSLEPLSGEWRQLPTAPIHPAVPNIASLGGDILAWSYDPETDGIAALDTETLQWRDLPRFPGQPTDGIPTAAVIGPREVMMTSETMMAIYSEGSNEWRTIPTPTADIGPIAPSAWTGTEALFLSTGLPPGDPKAPDGIAAQFWSYTSED